MSVLEDCSTTDGDWIRQLCTSLHANKAARVFKWLKNFRGTRMQVAQYSQSLDEIGEGMLSMGNHYWLDDYKRANWGTATGTWCEFLSRLEASKSDWRGDMWLPALERCTNEQRARDLLTAGRLFPFLLQERHEDSMASMVIEPIISKLPAKSTYFGSNAVQQLVLMCERDGEAFRVLQQVQGKRASQNSAEFREMNKYQTLFSVGTSPCVGDALTAANRADSVDWDRAAHADRFLVLADFAKRARGWMHSCSRRGAAHRKTKRVLDEITVRSMDRPEDEEYLRASLLSGLWSESGNKDTFWRPAGGSGLVFAACKGLVVVRIMRQFFVLTGEDLKALVTVGVSHGMWHMYSASIKVEYAASSPGYKPDCKEEEIRRAAAQLNVKWDEISRQLLGPDRAGLAQRVATYAEVTSGVDKLWALYVQTLSNAVVIDKSDYVGRYLHEMFEVYTSKLGGDMSAAGLHAQLDEFDATYACLGFSPGSDYNLLADACDKLPLSVVQDFGRLAKICGPYDVDPIYSFISRANAMKKPNRVGEATFTSEFNASVRDLTPAEHVVREAKYKSACHIMITMADMKSGSSKTATPEEAEAMAGMAWHDLVAEVLRRNKLLCSKVQLRALANPCYAVPDRCRVAARKAAKALLTTGAQPKDPWAGAYLDIKDCLAYRERGEPDIALLKPTGIPDYQYVNVFSNASRVPRATPTRDHDGHRQRGRGKMITDWLMGHFPSRSESLSYVVEHVPIANTSDKIETSKYPLKTRIITSLCGPARRLQGEYEYNNGRVLVHCPSFMVGIDPAVRQRGIYASMRDDLAPDKTRIFGSLDLSSFSAGMNWDIQKWTNEVLEDAYDGGADVMRLLDQCTIGSYMVRCDDSCRLPFRNTLGSNYEGIDGKRNTFMHATLWYLGRCEAAAAGVVGVMRAFIYIDDGSFSMEVDRSIKKKVALDLRHSIFRVYTRYGFKLSLLKTVFSETYMQFLNEIYMHGIHVGYGFRALCHTASRTFPTAATIREELAVIHGGIQGAATSGGHALRLLIGMNYLYFLYLRGTLGSKGESIKVGSPLMQAVMMYLPSLTGHLNCPNWVQLYTNLSGHTDAEKHHRLSMVSYTIRTYVPDIHAAFRKYIKAKLTRVNKVSNTLVPDRLTIAHGASSALGALDRASLICEGALEIATNTEAIDMISEYRRSMGKPAASSFAAAFVAGARVLREVLPMTLVETALSSDPDAAVAKLVKKVESSNMVGRFIKPQQLRLLNSRYRSAGRRLAADMVYCFVM